MTAAEEVQAAAFTLAAARHAAYVTERARAALSGARDHREQLEQRHERELAAADQQIADADDAVEDALAEQSDRDAAAALVPAEHGGAGPGETTQAAAQPAAADGGAH